MMGVDLARIVDDLEHAEDRKRRLSEENDWDKENVAQIRKEAVDEPR